MAFTTRLTSPDVMSSTSLPLPTNMFHTLTTLESVNGHHTRGLKNVSLRLFISFGTTREACKKPETRPSLVYKVKDNRGLCIIWDKVRNTPLAPRNLFKNFKTSD